MIIETFRTQQNGKLFAALSKAQAEARFVKKDKPSNFGDRPYAASESIIDECKEHLNKHGLALLPIAFAAKPDGAVASPPEADLKTTWLKRPLMTERYFKLGHESGEFEIIGPYDWPTNPNNMNTNFTAFGGTDTFSLAYVYRDVLGMPRLTAQEIKQIELEDAEIKKRLGILAAQAGETVKPEPKPEAAKPQEKAAEQKPAESKPKEIAKPAEKSSTVHQTNPAVPKEQALPNAGQAAGASPAASTLAPSAATPAASSAPQSPGEAAKANPPQGAASAPASPSGTSSTSQTESPASSEKSSATSGSVTPAGSSASPAGSTTASAAASAAPASNTTTTSGTTPAQPAGDDILKARQTAILSRLMRHAEKRIKLLSGDATALGLELNTMACAPADKPIMSEGKFKRSGLTDEAMKKLDGALQMAGV